MIANVDEFAFQVGAQVAGCPAQSAVCPSTGVC
jgi:hypothetical protein